MMLPVQLLQPTPNQLQQSSPTQEERVLEGSSRPSLNLRRASLSRSMQPTVELPALELDHIASSEINSVCKKRKIRASRKVIFMLAIIAWRFTMLKLLREQTYCKAEGNKNFQPFCFF